MSEKLPTVSGTSSSSGASGSADGSGPPNGGPPPVMPETAPTWRLLATLAVAGALAGLLLVLVFQATDPAIQAHRARVLAEAIDEVLGGPDHYETLFVVGDELSASPASVDTAGLERVYLGFDAEGRSLGYAIVGGEPGFQDVIRLIFGYEPTTGHVLGMKVLESKETPGLGDKIEKDSVFVGRFLGVMAPLLGVKRGAGRGVDGEVEMVTGATISSRTVIDIINHRLADLEGPLRAFDAARAVEQTASTPPPPGGRR